MNCKVCEQKLYSTPLLKYENMPSVAQNFPDQEQLSQDKGVDLEVFQCKACGLVQLQTEPVPYYRDVIRAAGYSKEMGEFRLKQFRQFLEKYKLIDKKVIEMGCGQGEYATLMKEAGADVYGIEHLDSSVEACKRLGLNVEKNYIESSDQKLRHGPFDAFFILNFLEHVPHINTYLKGISNNLNEGGLGLVEVPNFDMILKENMFCEFMTDHLFYFTKESLLSTLALNGFEVLEFKEVWHSYILSAVVRKRTQTNLKSFEDYQKKLEADLNKYISNYPANSVSIWGAGHQALAVMSLGKLEGQIKYVFDSAPFKQNKYTPATHIPIVAPQKLNEDTSIQAVIVMGASYSDEIVRILRSEYRKGISIAVLRSNGLEVLPN